VAEETEEGTPLAINCDSGAMPAIREDKVESVDGNDTGSRRVDLRPL
jgi:hypothetical protein